MNYNNQQRPFDDIQDFLKNSGFLKEADASADAGGNPAPDPTAVSSTPDSPTAPTADATTATAPTPNSQSGDTAAGADSINQMMSALSPDLARNITSSIQSIIDGNKEKSNGIVQEIIIPSLLQYINQTLQSPDYVNMILQNAMGNQDFMSALSQQVSTTIQSNMMQAMAGGQMAPQGQAPQGAPAPQPQPAPAPAAPQQAPADGGQAPAPDQTKSSSLSLYDALEELGLAVS